MNESSEAIFMPERAEEAVADSLALNLCNKVFQEKKRARHREGAGLYFLVTGSL